MKDESKKNIDVLIANIRKTMPNIIANAIIESGWDRMKVRNWRYDDGKPIYSETIKQHVGVERMPSWCCTFRDHEIARWIEDQEFTDDKDYELIFRFNSGDPMYFLSVYNEELATAFALRWV